MAPAGSRADRASSCRCACSRSCSVGCSCESSRTPSTPASCASSAISPTLPNQQAFAAVSANSGAVDWVVYAKPPFGGPEQVLAYLGRYTHRVAIANSRLISLADGKVRFTWKDYRGDHGKQGDDARQPTSSSAVFCCTSSRTVSIASATMASSPMVDAATISSAVVNYSMPVSTAVTPEPADNRTKDDCSFRAAATSPSVPLRRRHAAYRSRAARR